MTDFQDEDQDTGLPVDLGPDDGNYDERQDIVNQETPEKEAAGEDLSQPMFEYESPDGKVQQLTGQQILDLLEAQNQGQPEEQTLAEKVAALEEMIKASKGQPTAQQGQGGDRGTPDQPTPEQIAKYDEDLGNRIVGMFEGEHGGPAALGQLFRTSIAQMADMIFEEKLASYHQTQEQTQQQKEVQTKFEKDNADFRDTIASKDFKAFMSANRGYQFNTIEGYYAFKVDQLSKQVEEAKAGVAGAKAQGEKDGEKKVLQNMKARGTLRTVGGGARNAAFQKSGAKVDVNDEGALQRAALAALHSVRQQAG